MLPSNTVLPICATAPPITVGSTAVSSTTCLPVEASRFRAKVWTRSSGNGDAVVMVVRTTPRRSIRRSR